MYHAPNHGIVDVPRLRQVLAGLSVIATQAGRVVTDLIEMGRWHVGDRDILVVFDAGCDALRMDHLLRGCRWRSSGGCARTG